MRKVSHAFDQSVERQCDDYNALAASKGLDAARDRAIEQFTAITLWLKDTYGARQTYGVVQAAADQLAAFECRRAVP
jgi:hypothetical protein